MSDTFDTHTINRLAAQLKEPAWLTELRRAALARHGTLPWPHASDDIWRRTDVTLLDPGRGFTSAQARPSDASRQAAQEIRPLGEEALVVRLDGQWLRRPTVPNVSIQDLAEAAHGAPEPLRAAITADGLSDAEQKLSTLNVAFHQDDLVVRVAADTSQPMPLRLVHVLSAGPKQAVFPLTVLLVASGSTITVIDEYISLPGSPEPHLINARIELVVEPGATVHYVRLQRWAPQAREFLLQRATLGRGASLTMANINLGASLSKAHLVTKLVGEGASTKLYGFVFGHDRQHIDQHTLQDHQAPRTTSDLHFRAALQDRSRMVYTGLIRIAPAAQQTQAFQANHNLLLSQGAQAETIPMLEILADDVQCKHGASIGPIDEEQAFYLMSRGLPRPAAERLIVMGFVQEVVQQVPFEPLQEAIRREIESGLHGG